MTRDRGLSKRTTTSSRRPRAWPLVSYAVILSLLAATTTGAVLTVESYLDTASYPTGIAVTDAELAALHLQRDDFHGEWNYTLLPRTTQDYWVVY